MTALVRMQTWLTYLCERILTEWDPMFICVCEIDLPSPDLLSQVNAFIMDGQVIGASEALSTLFTLVRSLPYTKNMLQDLSDMHVQWKSMETSLITSIIHRWIIQVWNNMRVTKRWQIFYLWVNSCIKSSGVVYVICMYPPYITREGQGFAYTHFKKHVTTSFCDRPFTSSFINSPSLSIW